MPTTRPRHFVTETDDLAAALDLAAHRWPDLTRSQLLVRLALAAAEPLAEQERLARRREAVIRHSGTFDYPSDYLERLREDWPE